MAEEKIDLKIDAQTDVKPDAKPIPNEMAPAPADTFQNIFSQKKDESKDAAVLTNIVAQKTQAPKIKPILGSAPALQKSLEQAKEEKQKKKLRLVQTLFLLVFAAGLGMVGYLYSELSPTFDLFGPNTTAKLTDINKNLRSSQTTINKYRYLAAQLDLNGFSFVADDYLDKTGMMATNAASKETLSSAAKQDETDLPAILKRVKENLAPDIVLTTYKTEAEEQLTDEQIKEKFVTDLKDALQADRNKLASVQNLSAENEQEIKLIDNTMQLAGNTGLIARISAAPVDGMTKDLGEYTESLDPTLRKKVQDFMSSILASTKSDLAIIGAIKNERYDWQWIIEKIEEVTIKVDPNFNKNIKDLFEVTGKEIVYNAYELDADSKKIVLSGETKTNDGRNFTLISSLLDELENSPYFQNVEMRSFSKSGDLEKGFTSSFNIDLEIENGPSSKDKPISLLTRKVAVKGTKRTIN